MASDTNVESTFGRGVVCLVLSRGSVTMGSSTFELLILLRIFVNGTYMETTVLLICFSFPSLLTFVFIFVLL